MLRVPLSRRRGLLGFLRTLTHLLRLGAVSHRSARLGQDVFKKTWRKRVDKRQKSTHKTYWVVFMLLNPPAPFDPKLKMVHQRHPARCLQLIHGSTRCHLLCCMLPSYDYLFALVRLVNASTHYLTPSILESDCTCHRKTFKPSKWDIRMIRGAGF